MWAWVGNAYVPEVLVELFQRVGRRELDFLVISGGATQLKY